MAAVIVLLEDGSNIRQPFTGEAITLGRDDSNDISLADGYLSRRHCALKKVSESSVVLEDMGSSNGTYVNGSRVEGTQPVGPGDVIRIGRTRLFIDFGPEPEDGEVKVLYPSDERGNQAAKPQSLEVQEKYRTDPALRALQAGPQPAGDPHDATIPAPPDVPMPPPAPRAPTARATPAVPPTVRPQAVAPGVAAPSTMDDSAPAPPASAAGFLAGPGGGQFIAVDRPSSGSARFPPTLDMPPDEAAARGLHEEQPDMDAPRAPMRPPVGQPALARAMIHNASAEERTRQNMQLLADVAGFMNSTYEADEFLDFAMGKALEAVPAERGVLLLYDQATRRLYPGAFKAAYVERTEELRRLGISHTVSKRALIERKAMLVEDAGADHRFGNSKSIHTLQIRSVVAVPLWRDSVVRGLLYLDNRVNANAFSGVDIELLTALANLIAIGLSQIEWRVRSIATAAAAVGAVPGGSGGSGLGQYPGERATEPEPERERRYAAHTPAAPTPPPDEPPPASVILPPRGPMP